MEIKTKKELEKLSEELAELLVTKHLSEHSLRVSAISERLREKEIECFHLKEKLEGFIDIEDECEALGVKLASTSKRLKERESENLALQEELEAKVASASRRLQERESESLALQKELEAKVALVSRRLQERESESLSLQEELEAKVASVSKRLQEKESESLALQKESEAKLASSVEGLREREAECLLLRGKLEQCEKQKHLEINRHKGALKAKEELEFIVDDLRSQNESLSSTLIQREEMCKQIREQNALLEKKLNEMESDVERTNAALTRSCRELSEYKTSLLATEAELIKLKESAAFMIGEAFLEVRKRPASLVKLPFSFMNIRKHVKRRNIGNQPSVATDEDFDVGKAGEIVAKYGLNAAELYARRSGSGEKKLAKNLTDLAKLIRNIDKAKAIELAKDALMLEPAAYRARWFASLLFDFGYIDAAHERLQGLSPKEREKLGHRVLQIEGQYKLRNLELNIPHSAENPITSLDKHVLYVASSVLPYHVSGYTTRTQSVLTAISGKGWKVKCVTRPGYPSDRPDRNDTKVGKTYSIDGIQYHITGGKGRRDVDPYEYMFSAALDIESQIRAFRPAVVHAASNYETALPAMIAARRCGVPFFYEVRGLWEYTAASKRQGWEGTERFMLERELESIVCKHANGIFTLTGALKDELISRGAKASSISLLPNAIDPHKFQPKTFSESAAKKCDIKQSDFVVGYIGSIVGYEGLDDLVSAVQMLVRKVKNTRLLIVGGGGEVDHLKSLVASNKLNEFVRFVGKVPPDEVHDYFSLLDVIALPRKNISVCKLVSPLKPLEAMAMKVPMVVSSVDALSEMVEENVTALIHESENPYSLYTCLRKVAEDKKLGVRLAQNAREYVLEHRTWEKVIDVVVESYPQQSYAPN